MDRQHTKPDPVVHGPGGSRWFSLESTLDALRTLFEQNYADSNSNLNAPPTATGNREAYYANLNALQTWLGNSPFTAFSITSLAEQDAAALNAGGAPNSVEGLSR